MGRITETVKTLIIINVIFFVGSALLSEGFADSLFALWFPKHPNFKIWQLLTHMFMHGGVSHLLFNMFALYMFGSQIENALGQQRFLFLYFSAGLGALGLQVLSNYYGYLPSLEVLLNEGNSILEIHSVAIDARNRGQIYLLREPLKTLAESFAVPMVGASGAIFGVVVAFAVLYPNLPLMMLFFPVPIKAKYLIGGYVVLDLYAALTGNNIIGPSNTANWAHLGGALIGFIVIWYWKKNSFNDRRWN